MQKIKIGDKVKVMVGRDKGREGTVERVDLKKGTVLLPGVNMYKKHVKPSQAVDKKGGIFEMPRPLAIAKVAVICPNCNKATRVGLRVEGDQKIRFCKKCDRNLVAKVKETKPKKTK